MFRAAVMVVCVLAARAVPANELTELEAVNRALAQEHISLLLQARQESAAADAAAAGLWANPEVEYSREAVDIPGGSTEERSLWIRQRLNVAGVYKLERAAAEQGRVAEYARTELAAREIAAEVRTLFYEALAGQHTEKLLANWDARLKELTQSVTDRVAAGDASRYDYLRLQHEVTLVSGERLEAQARARSLRERLFSLIGGETAEPTGQLLPPQFDQSDAGPMLAAHPALQALNAQAEREALSAKALGRKAWPELILGAGRRELTEPGIDAEGNLISLGIEIPLFDRGTSRKAAAQSRARRLRAEYALAEARLAADVRAAMGELTARRQSALALETSVQGGDVLAGIAESAYAAGEIEVMALIDAHRTDLAVQQALIGRALAARRTYIELQSLAGEL